MSVHTVAMGHRLEMIVTHGIMGSLITHKFRSEMVLSNLNFQQSWKFRLVCG
jgi:hypothetical protein